MTAQHDAPLTLEGPAPRSLRLIDHMGLWANLGVSLFAFSIAVILMTPVATPLSLAAALVALVAGTAIGTAGLAAAAVPGAKLGVPSMMMLRGLFGTRASYLPTALNIVQLLGWTTFELVIIGTAMHQVTPSVAQWVYVLGAGITTTLLALKPLGWIRVLRKYITVLVLVALAYFLVQILRHPLPGLNDGSWDEFWLAVDAVAAVAVSWVPVVSDYSRHARSAKEAAIGTFVGFSVAQVACYVLALFTLLTVAHGDPKQVFGSFLAVPLGGLAFAVLAIREVDQSFADTYSTAISIQNLRPVWDRRLVALAVGTIATTASLALTIDDYYNFLVLIGAVFIPLLGVLVVDWFAVSRQRWNVSAAVPTRWANLAAWAVGFVTYQLINPGSIGWWRSFWLDIAGAIGFASTTRMSASLLSFAAAAVATLGAGLLRRRSIVAAEGGVVELEADADASFVGR